MSYQPVAVPGAQRRGPYEGVAGLLLGEIADPERPIVQIGTLPSLIAELVRDEPPHGLGIANPRQRTRGRAGQGPARRPAGNWPDGQPVRSVHLSEPSHGL